MINLNWGDFATSGGYIYAEYKTSGNVTYKSSYIPVIKNATLNGGGTINPPADAPNPTKISNTLCCNQTIRQGEKPAPIIGSQYNDPYSNQIYGINSRWTLANGSILNLDNTNKTLYLDYNTELKNITIYRELGYNGNSAYPNKSNTVSITVVPSPVISNIISIDAPIGAENYSEIITTNMKEITGQNANINLNILQNPFYIPKRGDIIEEIERYEWEYSKTTSGLNWTTISNENNSSLNLNTLPYVSNSEDNFYLVRRIVVYRNTKSASNTLRILIRTIRNNNSICCDQNLKIISSQEIQKPDLIVGSIAVSEKNAGLFYQWQKQPINNGDNKWTDIPGATSKDYLPLPLEYVSNGRGTSIQDYKFRRIAKANYYLGEISYSNEVNISPSYERTPSSIIIYPNPATLEINIENKDNIFNLIDTKISIVDITGAEVNYNNFSIINSNLININVSNLIAGTYFINIQNLINGRRTVQQFTFFKN